MSHRPPNRNPSGTSSDACFVTTRWTVVVQAGHKSSPNSDQALAELCQTYWYPLYAYARRRTASREQAEDAVQGFFARFLARNYLTGLSSGKGRFRAFLLASLKHFLVNEWEKATRQKRGGGVTVLSLDWRHAEARYRDHEGPTDSESPDRLYDREWALALLGRVIARLEAECAAAGKHRLFTVAKTFLTFRADAVPQAAAAAELGIEEGALRVAVHRLRRRYRELLRDEIGQTLADPAAVDEELRSLRAALSG
ncbi:MAG: sigma-70 family RNA polymerase sigma factor [Verrucomicrobiales bacterium]|nr:sigma-70 family RNA polymerase sigma factor [Verrucomicrobiales bacterium]